VTLAVPLTKSEYGVWRVSDTPEAATEARLYTVAVTVMQPLLQEKV
jgi:protein subunit release factor A